MRLQLKQQVAAIPTYHTTAVTPRALQALTESNLQTFPRVLRANSIEQSTKERCSRETEACLEKRALSAESTETEVYKGKRIPNPGVRMQKVPQQWGGSQDDEEDGDGV